MNPILVFGTNHRFAPVECRERISFSRDDILSALGALHAQLEIAILSTCNRLEFYVVAQDAYSARQCIVDYLIRTRGVAACEIQNYFYEHAGDACSG